MLLPIKGQKVEVISPGSLEEGVRDGGQELTKTSNGVAITTSFGHDLNTPIGAVEELEWD